MASGWSMVEEQSSMYNLMEWTCSQLYGQDRTSTFVNQGLFVFRGINDGQYIICFMLHDRAVFMTPTFVSDHGNYTHIHTCHMGSFTQICEIKYRTNC